MLSLAGRLTLGQEMAVPPESPMSISTRDHHWDDGTAIDVIVGLPDLQEGDQVVIERSRNYGGYYEEVARVRPTADDRDGREVVVTVEKNEREVDYWFRAAIVNSQGEISDSISTPIDSPQTARRQLFDGQRGWMLAITLLLCGSIVVFIFLARTGIPLKVRKIAGLDAVEEAVGRATEMGRSCLFIPGIQDMNEMQTIAGLTILSRVAQQAAEYDCLIETPTARSLVMTAARETVESAYLLAGRPDAYNEDTVYYVTDEQFAYVSYLTGKMVREKPAACFYLGSFYAESLILAETGNAIGAIQVAGTAQPAQLPFFVAACDYTLIGEEFFAASAYLSGNPDQLGSLKGQDVGKIIVGGLILVGVILYTAANLSGSDMLAHAAHYVKFTMLHAGG
ncbi:MAG: hypothetical protein KDA80_21405 [Planctomycetaceae bacterium]|nr:hypothetical protein [Planctomycetaceae bacterium]